MRAESTHERSGITAGQVFGWVLASAMLAYGMLAAFGAWVFPQNGLASAGAWLGVVVCLGGALGVIRAALTAPDPWSLGFVSAALAGMCVFCTGSCAYKHEVGAALRHVEVDELEAWAPPTEPVFLTLHGAELALDRPVRLEFDESNPEDEARGMSVYQLFPIRAVASGKLSPSVFAAKEGTGDIERTVMGPAYPNRGHSTWDYALRNHLASAAGLTYRDDVVRLEPTSDTYDGWVSSHAWRGSLWRWLGRLVLLFVAAIVVIRDRD